MSFKKIIEQQIKKEPDLRVKAAFVKGAVFTARHLQDVATSNPFLSDTQWDKLSLRDIKEALDELLEGDK